MDLSYTLQYEDFLNYQLYDASCNERIIKKRRRSRMIIPIAYFTLGILLFLIDSPLLSSFFIVAAIAWYFLYPIYSTKKYFNHYNTFIREKRAAVVGKDVSLRLTEDHLLIQDFTGESKLNLDQFDSIIEISSNYFVKMKTGVHLILPKQRDGKDIEEVTAWIQQVSSQLSLPIVDQRDWVWQ